MMVAEIVMMNFRGLKKMKIYFSFMLLVHHGSAGGSAPLISLQTGQIEQPQVGSLLLVVAEETGLRLGGSHTSNQILHSWANLLIWLHPTTGGQGRK